MRSESREKRLSLALVILLAVLTIAAGLWLALAPGEEGEDETWERIQEEGLIRIAMDASYPPFEYIDDGGELVGYDVDLAWELARRFDVDVEFVIISFDGLYDALRVGRVDLIISALPFDSRLTEDVVYSHSYFNAGQVLVVRQTESGIASVEDLPGQRVGVEWGSMGDVEARQLLRRMEFELLPYASAQEALTALNGKELDAAITDVVSTYEFSREEGGISIVGPPVTEDPYVMATRPNSFVLQEQVNAAILELSESGFLDELRLRWF